MTNSTGRVLVADGEELLVCLVEVLAEVGEVLGCGERAMSERDLDLPHLVGVSSLDRKPAPALSRPAPVLARNALHLSAQAGEHRIGAGESKAAVVMTPPSWRISSAGRR